MHIVGPLAQYPFSENRSLTPPQATWEDYRATSAKLGLERCVIVQPSFYASDNACTLDAVSRSEGRAWMERSNAHFPPSSERARLLAEANPERILWGTDWPHVSYGEAVPDDGGLLDALADWFPDEQLRTKALVDNPDRLYFQPG